MTEKPLESDNSTKTLPQPTASNLLVQELIPEKIGNIEIPESLRFNMQINSTRLYRVILVGPGKVLKNGQRQELHVKPGDRVICHSYTEGSVNVDCAGGIKIINYDTVIAVIPRQESKD